VLRRQWSNTNKMNILYGAVVIVVSFAVAKFVSSKNISSSKILWMAGGLEFVFVSAIGSIFYFFRLGFFARLTDQSDVLVRIFGLAIFLAVIVAMKALNNAKAKELETDAEPVE